MNKDDRKTLMHIQHILGRKPTEKELKAYEALKKVILGDTVKKNKEER